ncbi:MAG: caspase family protein [Deltaproteobacteria bacterium]|nr:caspase family protein [Deltaproteobacteria bacterium]
MPKTNRKWIPFILMLMGGFLSVGLFTKGCASDSSDEGDGNEENALEDLSTEVQQAASLLLEDMTIETTAKVIVVGPVPSGTLLQENLPEGHTDTAVELEVPSSSGTYYTFFIDDNPDFKFAHVVRYAWLNVDDGSSDVAEASFPMIIQRPGEAPQPFSYSASGTVGDVTFDFASGDGAGDPEDVDDIPTDDGTTAVDAGLTLFRSQVEGNCRKQALVVDGGEARGYFFQSSLADNMAEDADSMASYVEASGFTVTRRSQYWGNDKTAFDSPENTSFENTLERFIEYFGAIGCENLGACFCHEFFIYVASHGDTFGFALYPKDGEDVGQVVFYNRLLDILGRLPACVKVTIFIDACYSGGLITQNQAPILGTSLSDFCNNHCGLTLITAVDVDHGAYGGQGFDSGTEDFTQGSESDHDGDGKTGDLHDRVTEMQNQGSSLSPQLFFCEGQSSLCSLD